MVTANVDNDRVSIVLTPGDSVTVPSGEVWDVEIGISYAASGFNGGFTGRINGQAVLTCHHNYSKGKGIPASKVSTVVTGGDTISLQSDGFDSESMYISGYKV